MQLISDDELYHFNPFHDRLGRFASRNGSVRSVSVKNQNNKNDKNNKNKNNKHGLSKNQKRALAIGGAVLATALASYGGYTLYKNKKLDFIKKLGKNKVQEAVDKAFENGPEIRLASSMQTLPFGFKKDKGKINLRGAVNGINPFIGKPGGNKNCVSCSIAGFLKSEGYWGVKAMPMGEGENLGGVVERCFKNATVLDGWATKFGKSPKDAEEFLVKRFGNDAKGVVSIHWKGGKDIGHAFNWQIIGGKATFADCQSGTYLEDDPFADMFNDPSLKKLSRFWNKIDEHGMMTIARLDNAEPIYEELDKIVKH